MPPPTHQQPSSLNHPTTTTTLTATQTLTSTPVLRLRATAPSPHNRRRIQWAEDVVDNEGLGRKRSKVCCIYHAPHPVGESSSESSSSSDSSSDDDSAAANESDGRARMGGKGKATTKKKKKKQRRQHSEDCGHDRNDGGVAGDQKGRVKKKSANAYEAVPKVQKADVIKS